MDTFRLAKSQFPTASTTRHERPSGKVHARAALTRGEVLIGAIILLLLLLLLSPYLLQRRSDARRISCEFRQIELAKALNAYSALYEQYPGYRVNQLGDSLPDAPAAAEPGAEEANEDARPGVPIGWIFTILPVLEAPAGSEADTPAFQMIYDAYGPQGPAETRGRPPAVHIPTLLCPASSEPRDADQSRSSYIANTGMPDAPATAEAPADWPANGVLQAAYPPSPYPMERVSHKYVVEHDGAANTLLVTENSDSGLWIDHDEPLVGFVWTGGLVDGVPARGDQLLGINEKTGQGDGSYRFARPSSHHPGGVNAVYCSGRTQFLNARMDYLAFTQLMTSNAAEIMQPGSRAPLPAPYQVPDDAANP